MKTAIFPGSFDPFTLGHLDVLESALGLFDKIVVGVGCNHRKKGFMTPENRIALIRDVLDPLDTRGTRLEVAAYTGLTVDFCRKMGASYMIRGLRTATDFEMESVIAQANREMDPGITTLFIPASHECAFISSTVVRDILVNGGDASLFLPENIQIKKYIK